jgi:hypothetical protein
MNYQEECIFVGQDSRYTICHGMCKESIEFKI